MIINRGASLGLNFWGIEFVQILILIILGILWRREKGAWGFGLMIIGGELNFIEKYQFGGVIDYWRIPLTPIYNNINDYLITAGVIQLIYYLIWKKRQK